MKDIDSATAFMDKSAQQFRIGISLEENEGRHFRKYIRKGFGFVEFSPGTSDIPGFISDLTGRKSGYGIAINMRFDASGMNEDELTKKISADYSFLYDFVDMFTIDVKQQNFDYAEDIINAMVNMRMCYDSYKPLLVRLTAGLSADCVDEMLRLCRLSGIDGIITRNYATIIEKVNKRFPVYAEMSYANPSIVADVFSAGAEAVLVHAYRPGCGFVRKCHKACSSKSRNK